MSTGARGTRSSGARGTRSSGARGTTSSGARGTTSSGARGTTSSGARGTTSSRRPSVEDDARSVVDYALVRHTTLRRLVAGRVAEAEVCDAQPYLLRAARYHGVQMDEPCPVCKRKSLKQVRYTYGDCFREGVNGRARTPRELPELAGAHSEFTVFVVEVCPECRWNHLLASYVLGNGEPARRRARS